MPDTPPAQPLPPWLRPAQSAPAGSSAFTVSGSQRPGARGRRRPRWSARVRETDSDVWRLRADLELSQAAMASVLGVSSRTLWSIENGEQKPSRTVARLVRMTRRRDWMRGEAVAAALERDPDEALRVLLAPPSWPESGAEL